MSAASFRPGRRAECPRLFHRPLIVSHSGKLAGAERWLVDVVKILVEAGAKPTVAGPKGPLASTIESLGVAYRPVAIRWWASAGRPGVLGIWAGGGLRRSAIPELSRLARRHDVVMSNTSVMASGIVAAGIARVPHLWAIHELREDYHYVFGSFGLAAVARRSKRVILNSKTTARSWRTLLGATPAMIIRQPVSPGAYRWQPSTSSKLKVLTLASIVPCKRIDLSLRVLSALVRGGHDADLTLAGPQDPRYVTALRKLAGSLGIEDRTHFVGCVDDVSLALSKSDVLLHPSGRESYGRVIAEALVVGTPVVARDGGAASELLQHGALGALFTTPEEAASAIVRSSRFNSRAERISREVRRVALKLTDRADFSTQILQAFSAGDDGEVR